MGRLFVMGDIHGAYKALLQCLERATFDYENDRLIFLGDICDGWPETAHCFEELLKIRNLVYVLGNHDWWMLDWIANGNIEEVWFVQGGKSTIESYAEGPLPRDHRMLLESALPYYFFNNKVFVHAGFATDIDLDLQSPHTFLWDRSLARKAIQFENNLDIKLTKFDEVYIGHTPVSGGVPLRCGDVWMMDTGAGWSGVLSLMNVDTKEVYISDPVPSLYPGIQGRSKR